MHDALCTVAERLAGQLEGARFERRAGYELLAFPMFPLPSFNGIWAESDAAVDELEAAVAEAEDLGLPIGVVLRDERTPGVAQRARELGFSLAESTPAMVTTPGELQIPDSELDILQIRTADGLAQALAVAATGFEIPGELLAALYLLEVAALEGIEYYLARLDEQDVCTAIGYTVDKMVGIFNVATPPEFRRRGYGSIITAHAVQAGFDAGADFAYLQSSALGESVYRRLGFRQVGNYTILVRRPEVSATS
jgi:ribosomal protein S18 acetylase RimI-like enzyme